MNFDSNIGTVTSEARNRRLFGISESLESMDSDNELEREFGIYNEEREFDMNVASNLTLENESKRNDTVLRECMREAEEDASRYIYEEAITAIYLASLPLSEECIEMEKEDLCGKCKEVVNNLYDNGFLNNKSSIDDCKRTSWDDYISKFSTLEKSIALNQVYDDEIVDKDDLSMIAKDTETVVSEDIEFFSETIKDKVMSVIKQERFLAENREEIYNENVNFDNKTLFNGLNVKNYNNLFREDSVIIDKTDTKAIAEIAFKEAVEDYTLIETLNTLGLINSDCDSVERAVKSLYR
jgi:hypothetical protein